MGERGSRKNFKRNKKRKYMKRCLKCGKEFPSTGRFHRLCKRCSHDNDKIIYKPLNITRIEDL